MFYLGMDVHGKWSTVRGFNPETGETVEIDKLANTREAMYEALGALEGPLHGVMEAGTNAFAMHRLLSPLFAQLVIADPSELWDRRRERTAKTDRRDAQHMAEKLYRGEITGIYVPSAEIQDMRTLGRCYVRATQWVNRLVSEMGSMLRGWGYVLPKSLLTKGGQELIERAQRELPAEAAFALQQWHTMLAQAQQIKQRLEQRLRARAAADPQCQLLQTIPMVGPVTALVARAEIGDIDRFRNGRALVSFAGLCARTWQSSERCSHGHLVPWGNRWMRYVLGLLGSRIQRSTQDSALRRLYWRTLLKHDKKSAQMGVARKAAHLMYHLLVHHEPYQEPDVSQAKRRRAKLAR